MKRREQDTGKTSTGTMGTGQRKKKTKQDPEKTRTNNYKEIVQAKKRTKQDKVKTRTLTRTRHY